MTQKDITINVEIKDNNLAEDTSTKFWHKCKCQCKGKRCQKHKYKFVCCEKGNYCHVTIDKKCYIVTVIVCMLIGLLIWMSYAVTLKYTIIATNSTLQNNQSACSKRMIFTEDTVAHPQYTCNTIVTYWIKTLEYNNEVYKLFKYDNVLPNEYEESTMYYYSFNPFVPYTTPPPAERYNYDNLVGLILGLIFSGLCIIFLPLLCNCYCKEELTE
jgi:hypothetical protein